MQLKTTSNSGLEQRLELFERSIGENDAHATIKKVDNETELFKEHKKKYSDYIHIPSWQELALVLQGPSVDPKDLQLLTTTSYHLQAVRKGGANDVIPVVVEGLVLTSDNKFVYGIRGGDVEKGKACICPAGSLSGQDKNPLFAEFYTELKEELGIKAEKSSIIGYQTDPDFTKGINFVFYMPTKVSSKEIDGMHKDALDVYLKALSNNFPEFEARKEIKRAGFPNTDAWEHTDLIFIDNNPGVIDSIIRTRTVLHGGKEYPMLDIGRGALILAGKYLIKED